MSAYIPMLALIVMIAFALAVVGLMGLAAWALVRVIRRNPPQSGLWDHRSQR
ncbi:hypothetical protein I41_21430 [Lacipirellula limnantheis]|uniref:Uncharacterized protein n=1 Tax=Lacipirellula limnantheis TaxID=2528024 RepID=A0A517TX55_9BACT|nr:hypothetical protein I41_21430 [Lacipirellula limnantheis]